LSTEAPVIAYLFTTFPKATETFLQREIIAMKRARREPAPLFAVGRRGLVSRPAGGGFNKWRLLTLLWLIPV
jgi:colanic acid/amylovoran biosynthesis glycosyltransferase